MKIPWTDSVIDWTWNFRIYVMFQTNELTTQLSPLGSSITLKKSPICQKRNFFWLENKLRWQLRLELWYLLGTNMVNKTFEYIKCSYQYSLSRTSFNAGDALSKHAILRNAWFSLSLSTNMGSTRSVEVNWDRILHLHSTCFGGYELNIE